MQFLLSIGNKFMYGETEKEKTTNAIKILCIS